MPTLNALTFKNHPAMGDAPIRVIWLSNDHKGRIDTRRSEWHK